MARIKKVPVVEAAQVEPVAEDTLPPVPTPIAGPALERGVDSGCDDGAA